MLKTKAEFATLRLNEDLKPYMSRYLSDLVSHMVEKYQPSSRTKRLIELCCRDFEFSSEHVDGPSWSVLGIDLKRPSAASFEFEDRVYNEATDEWDYVPACVCKNRVKVPTSTFTAIEENIFYTTTSRTQPLTRTNQHSFTAGPRATTAIPIPGIYRCGKCASPGFPQNALEAAATQRRHPRSAFGH